VQLVVGEEEVDRVLVPGELGLPVASTAMPDAVREVPFAGKAIPIVAPEHLAVRKVMLDRPKDWPDIEAMLVATEPFGVEEILRWLMRLVGPDDPRLAKLRELVRRLAT
jgi:hypothetical protein